jgi:hypothetical protein
MKNPPRQKPYRLTVQYNYFRNDPGKVDPQLFKTVGSISEGSGYDIGKWTRDHEWNFSSKEKAFKATQRLLVSKKPRGMKVQLTGPIPTLTILAWGMRK